MAMFTFGGFFGSSKVSVIDQNFNTRDFLQKISSANYRKSRDNARLKAVINQKSFINDSLLVGGVSSKNIASLKDFFLGREGKKPIYSSQKGKTKALLIAKLEEQLKTDLMASEDVDNNLEPLLDLAYELNRSIRKDVSRDAYAQKIVGEFGVFSNQLVRQWVAAPEKEKIKNALNQGIANATINSYVTGYSEPRIVGDERKSLADILGKMIKAMKESGGEKSFLKDFEDYLYKLELEGFSAARAFIINHFLKDLVVPNKEDNLLIKGVTAKIAKARSLDSSADIPYFSDASRNSCPHLMFSKNIPGLDRVASDVEYRRT